MGSVVFAQALPHTLFFRPKAWLITVQSFRNESDRSQPSMKPVGVENVVGRMADSLSATLSD